MVNHYLLMELRLRALNNLIKLKLRSNITYVDISAYSYNLNLSTSNNHNALIVIAKYCPNLTNLDISKIKYLTLAYVGCS